MNTSLHGVGMLLLPMITAVVCLQFWQRPGIWRVVAASALVMLFVCLGVTFAGGWRVPGAPFSQWAVPALCAAAVALCVSHRGVAVCGAAFIAGAMWLLLLSHAQLANLPQYTSNTRPFVFFEEWRSDTREQAVRYLEKAAARGADRPYPAGWLVQRVPVAAAWWTLWAIRRQACHRAVVTPLWHTWLTGLHHIRMSRVDLWYPGGPLRRSARRIEWRERPETMASP